MYLTSVDEIISESHGQKIAIFLGPTQEQLSIISINYVHVNIFLVRPDKDPDRFLHKLLIQSRPRTK